MKRELPTTLLEAARYFEDFENCREFLVSLRWPDGKVLCPQCGSDRVTYLANARLWKCYEKHSKAKFSMKTGTIFEDSPLPLDKWLVALWLIVNSKNGVSSCEMARTLGITQKSAWFMAHRLRLALHQGSFEKMSGTVEADETYIGGKSRFMHASKRKKLNVKPGRSTAGKVAVMGLLERHGEDQGSQVRTAVLDGLKRSFLQGIVRSHVEPGAEINSDSFSSYVGLNAEYIHNVIDHAETYVDGTVHTNGLENFWSLLKRALKGTYVSVEPFHLFRYLDEQTYRFNNRKGLSDFGRFALAAASVVDRRVTWKQLVGQEGGSALLN